MKQIILPLAALAAFLSAPAMAQGALPPAFHAGKAIPEFGKIATIDSDIPIPADTRFLVAFDVGKAAEGKINRTLSSAARFINMHDEAGVAPANVRLAIVVHGSAVFDMASDAAYARKYPAAKANPNAAIIAALVDNGVQIIICGQSAAYHGVAKDQLLPGVKMSLSAMTAHAMLQQDGYTLNPF
ncbi:MAG: DsrE family protein [Sphingorhabdus sp.]